MVVLGTSAGGVKVLQELFAGLPPGLPASFFVVQHVGGYSVLPEILAAAGAYPALHPKDGDIVLPGFIHVAPPDYHLLLEEGRVRLVHGPRENTFRPSIDVLFRSAARSYGPRVIGVVLTGSLGDGAAGLSAVKRTGGLAVVQDPLDAEYPSMPVQALRQVDVDHVLSVADMPAFLARAVAQPVPEAKEFPVSKELELETDIAAQNMSTDALMAAVETLGERTPMTCPECNGVIWEMHDPHPVRFRCHTGHVYTAEAFFSSQSKAVEDALRSALRLMEEKHQFLRKLEQSMSGRGLEAASRLYAQRALQLDGEAAEIRRLLKEGVAASGQGPAALPEDIASGSGSS